MKSRFSEAIALSVVLPGHSSPGASVASAEHDRAFRSGHWRRSADSLLRIMKEHFVTNQLKRSRNNHFYLSPENLTGQGMQKCANLLQILEPLKGSRSK